MLLKNVRLETNFNYKDERVESTKTQLFDIRLEEGKFAEIINLKSGYLNKKDSEEVLYCKEYLMLPSFCDNHIHLDKGHYGGDWKAVVPLNGVFERIKEEEQFLESFLEDTPKKAQALLDLILNSGVTDFKVQVNVDPVIDVKNKDLVKKVLEKNKDRLDYQLVCFPQHGLLNTLKTSFIDLALGDDKVFAMGAVDPATIDKDIEKSLSSLFELAKKYGKDIDIHLHDGGTLGNYEIDRIFDYTEKYGMKGHVYISHGFSLASLKGEALKKIAEKMAALGIGFNSTAPISGHCPDLFTLLKEGVRVYVVNDNVNDHWSPFGTGDILERLSRACEIFHQVTEYDLNRSLKLITKNPLPLDDEGNMVWPYEGAKANFVLIDSPCSAHAVARVPKNRMVFKNAKRVDTNNI